MKKKAICFYLPQFHPIPENNAWWGNGYTEWTAVSQARPLFEDHYQPHVPADLGFYDLRLAESRQAQADLARKYDIFGFCYYFYWFGGKELLQRPLNEVLLTKRPDFPFCVAWANDSWNRRWAGRPDQVLMEQVYSPDDDVALMERLSPMFDDDRYIRLDGRPIMLVYRPDKLPSPLRTTQTWRQKRPDIYLIAVHSFCARNPIELGFDAAVEMPPMNMPVSLMNVGRKSWHIPEPRPAVYDYEFTAEMHKIAVERGLNIQTWEPVDYPLFRSVMPSYDNTPRVTDGHVFFRASPEKYEDWLTYTLQQSASEFVFINGWNEWGEGCHLEPDLKHGSKWLEATQRAINAANAPTV